MDAFRAGNYVEAFGWTRQGHCPTLKLSDDEGLPMVCSYMPKICTGTMSIFNTIDYDLLNGDAMERYLAKRDGTSLKNMEHMGQLLVSGKFQRYDFGSAEANLEAYGQETPPLIPIENIKDVPIAMLVGKRDTLATWKDAEHVRTRIDPNLLFFYQTYEADHVALVIGRHLEQMTVDLFDILRFHNEGDPLASKPAYNTLQ